MASHAGSGASLTSSEYYWKQELFWMPGTNGCRIRHPQRISNEETQKGLTVRATAVRWDAVLAGDLKGLDYYVILI